MNIDKLKPWNWFKHEDATNEPIPISKTQAAESNSIAADSFMTSQNQTVGSLAKLHYEMDRLFDDIWRSFGIPSSSMLMGSTSLSRSSLFDNARLGDYRANIDVSGCDNRYEVAIDLPGLSEDDVQIELSGNTLTIKGLKEENKEIKDKLYYRMERSMGSFQRTLSLPEDADQNNISANMKNGLLVITIPRVLQPTGNVQRISISS